MQNKLGGETPTEYRLRKNGEGRLKGKTRISCSIKRGKCNTFLSWFRRWRRRIVSFSAESLEEQRNCLLDKGEREKTPFKCTYVAQAEFAVCEQKHGFSLQTALRLAVIALAAQGIVGDESVGARLRVRYSGSAWMWRLNFSITKVRDSIQHDFDVNE